MFRRTYLPPCPSELWKDKHTLKDLGLFINNEDQVRKIAKPDEKSAFKVSSNYQVNITYRACLHAMFRSEVEERVLRAGLQVQHLPQGVPAKTGEPRIPIYASPVDVLSDRKRVIVVVNDDTHDLGVFSYRVMAGLDDGIGKGSCAGFIEEIRRRCGTAAAHSKINWAEAIEDERTEQITPANNDAHPLEPQDKKKGSETGIDKTVGLPGIVILNPGQLVYSHKEQLAMTRASWYARPRPSALHDTWTISELNSVVGHADPAQHLDSVFQWLNKVAPKAHLYCVGIGSSGEQLLRHLDDNWTTAAYHERVRGLAFTAWTDFTPGLLRNPKLESLLRRRGRAWVVSDEPSSTKLSEGSDATPEILSAGPLQSEESIFPDIFDGTLDWFEAANDRS